MTKGKKAIVVTASVLGVIAVIIAVFLGVLMGSNVIQKAVMRLICKDEPSSYPVDYDSILAATESETVVYDGKNELDLITPKAGVKEGSPILVVYHGGYYVGGGRRNQEPFARYIASFGFIVANVDYSLAPESAYPTQITEANVALKLVADRYPERKLVITGDSAGAHLASQLTAATFSDELRAKIGIDTLSKDRLAGFIGSCGFYRASTVEDSNFFLLGDAIGMLLGDKNYLKHARLKELDVIDYAAVFPRTLLICGDKDALKGQNEAMAEALEEAGVEVDTYFPTSGDKELGHEFQCNYNLDESYTAAEKIAEFLTR